MAVADILSLFACPHGIACLLAGNASYRAVRATLNHVPCTSEILKMAKVRQASYHLTTQTLLLQNFACPATGEHTRRASLEPDSLVIPTAFGRYRWC